MNRKSTIINTITLMCIVLAVEHSANAQEFADLTGDYLGQTPPGDTPVMFAPGIVSTDYAEHSAPAFSPDGNEVFWWVAMIPGAGDEKWINKGMTMKRVGDRWTLPTPSPYYGEVFFSPDGKRLYFRGVYPERKADGPYYAEKQGDGWSKPKNLGLVARFPELKAVLCPSVTQDGTLYFGGDTVGESKTKDIRIYRAKLINGEYKKLELLPRNINLPEAVNGTPFVAPDESYLIFNSNRNGSTGKQKLYISFLDAKTDTWSEPVNMGILGQRYPAVSPDGKYLFFTRFSRFKPPVFDNDVFWVSAKIIERLKAETAQ
jgi:hypothetical protein